MPYHTIDTYVSSRSNSKRNQQHAQGSILQSMLNFVKYFAECHPRFRQIISRHFRTCVVLFVLFLVVFTWCEWSERRSVQPVTSSSHDDVTVALRAQLGYLKRKYAESLGQGVLDVNDASMPAIYAITPTFYRPVQKAELTRLCQTFLLVPNFHWVVVEDARTKSELVSRFLARCGVPYTHLNAQTPPENKMSDAELEKKNWKKPRGKVKLYSGGPSSLIDQSKIIHRIDGFFYVPST